MSDQRRYAIYATIPTPTDPHSKERMEWCKEAADAIVQVCLDHASEVQGRPSPSAIADACDGIRASFEHAMRTLRELAKKGTGR